jgi:hypothetical protein
MVGQLLRRERLAWQQRTGKRVEDLTASFGMTRPTLYLWESTRGRADPMDIRRLLEFYGCPEALVTEALRLRSLPLASDPPECQPDDLAPTVT